MLVDIDLDFGNKIVTGPGTRTLLSNLTFKRDTADEIRVRFWSGSPAVQTELATGAAGKFAVKPLGQYDADAVVLAESWTKEGTGSDTVYVFEPDFNGATLADLLNAGDDSGANDEDYVECMAEIRWVIDSKKRRTQTVNATVYHEVIKDDDGAPSLLPTLWAAPLLLTAIPVNDPAAVTTITTDDINWALGRYFKKADWNSGVAYTFSNVSIGKTIEIYLNVASGTAYDPTWPAGITWAAGAPAHTGTTPMKITITCTGAGAYSGSWTDTSITIPGSYLDGTAAEAMGQSAFVEHSTGDPTEWAAYVVLDEETAEVLSTQWLPRTGGIFRNEDTQAWERLKVSSSTIQSAPLTDQ